MNKTKELMFRSNSPRGAWARVLTVDPGLRTTGWAFWDEIERGTKDAQVPTATGIITFPKSRDWEECCVSAPTLLQSVLAKHNVKHLVLEFPQLWSGSATSMASGSRGDLFKLCYLVGAFGECFSYHSDLRHLNDHRSIKIEPQEWKGQLTKRTVDRRIARALDAQYPEHISDAVGIGLAIQGKL